MKILVTGGLGYIGSHTAVVLLEKGYEVLLVDNLSNTRAEVLDGIEAISGKRPEWLNIDLAAPAACRTALEGQHLDGIIHFAAFKAVGESVQEPLKYYQNNLGSLVNLLDYVSQHPSCGFIFSSSCTVYGDAEVFPITEESPIKPAESPYGNTKQIGEEIIRET
ncbi:MAG: SDR family NAD(P)-dependent oxidoreductase, partial [Schleiferiaceae bacterium]